MATGTYHVSPNATPQMGGSWTVESAFGVKITTDLSITGMKIPVINYTNTAITVNVTCYVDGILINSASFILDDDKPNEKILYNADVRLSASSGSIVIIRVYTGSPYSCSAYSGDYDGASILGSIPLSGRISDGQGTFGMECILDISYTPVWITDSQNDGYPYPRNTNPNKFTEFEKDEFGYPRNWGVWKLDKNNDGYPWMTGYEDYIVRGLPVKIMSQDKTHWINVLLGVFTAEKILNAYIKLIGDDEDADNGNAINSE